MYQRFLIYKHFFAGEVPVILCEGETDNVYLTHAIRSLARSYPQLATTNPAGKISLSIRLYKYRKSSTPRILGLHDGGTANLAKFIAIYKKETAKFKAPGQKQPVIILYDNDSGAKPIISAVSQAKAERNWTLNNRLLMLFGTCMQCLHHFSMAQQNRRLRIFLSRP